MKRRGLDFSLIMIFLFIIIIASLSGCGAEKPAINAPTINPLQSPPYTASTETVLPSEEFASNTDQGKILPIKYNIWTSIGPQGGYVSTIVIDPKTSTNLYAGTHGGGVFKSTNGGKNWSAANAGLTDFDVYSLAVDPISPSNLYAVSSYQMFKSTDSGENWSECTEISGGASNIPLLIDPVTPSTIYIGGAKSTDSCANFNMDTADLNGKMIFPLMMYPSNSTTIYALWSDGNLYKSLDSGVNWSLVKSDLPIFADGKLSTVPKIKIDPMKPTTLYAVVETQVLKSTNGGENWSVVSGSLNTSEINYLEIDPTSPDTIFIGTENGVFKSVNGGEQWNSFNIGKIGNRFSPSLQFLAIDPVNQNTLYIPSDNGISKSIDGGKNWNPINTGLNATYIKSLAIDPMTPTTIYAEGQSIFKSMNGGGSWDVIVTPDTQGYRIIGLVIDASRSSILYIQTHSGVIKSTDSGESWSEVPTKYNSNIASILAIDPISPSTLYAVTSVGTDENRTLLKSTNGGMDWSVVTTNFSDMAVSFLLIDPLNPSILYTAKGVVAGKGGGLFKSMDGGKTWDEIYIGLTETAIYSLHTKINSLVIDPKTPTTLYVGTSYTYGVLKSNDGGKTWNTINNGIEFPKYSVNSLAIDPSTPTIIYAGTDDGGVYKSINGGESWISLGLPNMDISTLVIDPLTTSTIYAATNGSGVFVLYQK